MKIAFYDAKSKGFKSKAQMRLLLDWARKNPSKYSWVFDVLREHGIPSQDEASNEYWEAPYNISPSTPSYTYKSRKGSMLNKLIKLANDLDENGYYSQAEKIDSMFLPASTLNENKAEAAAKSFMSLWENNLVAMLEKAPLTSGQMLGLEKMFEKFKPMQEITDSATKAEARAYLGDMIGALK